MQINPVIEAIYAAFKLEIANQFFLANNSIVVTLPDQKRLVISAPQVHPRPDVAVNNPTVQLATDKHTYQYALQNDRLCLTNTEDCRAYLQDVCENLLDVPVHDWELTFPDGTVYLLTISDIT